MDALAQLDPSAGSPVAVLGTFLAALARRQGRTARRALLVGTVPAVLSVLLQRYGPAVTIATTLLADFFAVWGAYRLGNRVAGMVALAHYTVTVILGITLYNLIALLGTAPT